MENAADALKIAFSILMFVLALTLGMSSFSEANRAVKAIVTQRDRETEYTYVEPSENFTRIVGVDTVIPTMYQAYRENFIICFLDEDENPLPLYYKTNAHDGSRVMDGRNPIGINYIDLSKESYGVSGDKTAGEVAIEHLDILLAGEINRDNPMYDMYKKLYEEQFIYTKVTNGGLYGYLKDKKFEERLGEYTQGEGASAITKRVITYKLQ